MINELQFEIQKQVLLQFNVHLSIDPEGHFFPREELSPESKTKIMSFIQGYSQGYVAGRTIAPANPKYDFRELRFDVAHALNQQMTSPLRNKLNPSEIAALAYQMRRITSTYPMNNTLYFTIENMFKAIFDILGTKGDLYLGKHNGFKALFEFLSTLSSEYTSYNDFKHVFSTVHYEKTIVASESLFHTRKLRKVLQKLS